jgi:glycosyltransferase involved in cell wall biosynthesis
MTKIAHIARPIYGVGVYISLLTKHIDNESFSNVLICNTQDNIIEPKDKLGDIIKIHHANIFRKIHPIKDFITLLTIIKILKKENPDIIHCHSAKAGILGRIAGFFLKKKTFYTPHAYSYLSQKTKARRMLFKFIERTISYLPAKTLACSNSEYIRAKKELKINKTKLCLWNNSIEEKISLSKVKLLEGLPQEYICTIGRPSYQKNTELLVRSIIEVKKLIKNIHLVILGTGLNSPSLEKIKNLIKENQLESNITIIPWLERLQTLKILKNSLFYVSTSRYEGLSYSLIEALALNKACIVTNVDGNKDLIIDKENGFVVSENELKIADKIHLLVIDHQLRIEMSEKAKILFIDKYTINKNISKLQEIYLSYFSK